MLREAQEHIQHLRGKPFYDALLTEVAIGLQKRWNVRNLNNNPANRVQRIMEHRMTMGADESVNPL